MSLITKPVDLDTSSIVGCMVDCETLGLAPDALVFQISMVAFDSSYYSVAEFDEYISVSDALLCGMTVTPATIAFWNRMIGSGDFCPDRVADMLGSTQTVRHTAKLLHEWMLTYLPASNFKMWAQGVLHDIPWVDNVLRIGGFPTIQEQFPYNTVQDLRTYSEKVREYDPVRMMDAETNIADTSSFLEHDARDDCLHQIEVLKVCDTLMQRAHHLEGTVYP